MKKKSKTFCPEEYSLVSNSANTVETLKFNQKFRNVNGMGWIVTCLFIVGETAGGGLIAMPTAMMSAGLFGGIFVILFGAIVCSYTGYQLSENWTILQERWPEYQNHCRKPYPAMGLRAMGPKFMTLVSIVLNATMFGTAVVFLLLASKNLENFLHAYAGIHIGFCYLVLIVAFFMFPLTLLKSPKDFWWVVIGAMMTTTIAVSLIIYGSVLDSKDCRKQINYPEIVPSKFFMCFGTVMFAYGGHGAFPTIQHDMKKPYQFQRSIFIAFLIIFMMYLPVSITGYLVYGNSLQDSIIPSLQEFFVQQTVNILITLHVVLALTIVFNPLNQELEEFLKIPHEMGIRRILTRGLTMLAVIFVVETIPNFGVLLDLVGGSTITLMALVFPSLFNLYLNAAQKKYNTSLASQDEKCLTIREVLKYTTRKKLITNSFILLFALIGGLTATASALNALLNSQFSAPCYASLFTGIKEANTEDIITTTEYLNKSVLPIVITEKARFNCCGKFKNISRFGTELCFVPFSNVNIVSSHG